jgi:hypothetical protein
MPAGPAPDTVMPAEADTQGFQKQSARAAGTSLGPRLRGDDAYSDLNSAATFRLGLMLADTRMPGDLALASQAGASSRCGGW